MNAMHMIGDDKKFKSWIRENPNGFVLNTNSRPNGNYLVLHTARCDEWRTDKTLTEGTYSKVVADAETGLDVWMALSGFQRSKVKRGCRCLR